MPLHVVFSITLIFTLFTLEEDSIFMFFLCMTIPCSFLFEAAKTVHAAPSHVIALKVNDKLRNSKKRPLFIDFVIHFVTTLALLENV